MVFVYVGVLYADYNADYNADDYNADDYNADDYSPDYTDNPNHIPITDGCGQK